MTSSRAGAARICGEQDCDERTNRPSHPLCYQHYLAFQNDDIDECPNHPGVYKPSQYDVCRICYSQRQQPAQSTRTTERQQPQDNSLGWNRQAMPEVKAVAQKAIEAVEMARRNLSQHAEACVNHESNTIQFLIMPILSGLGWDAYDPEQVRSEYKPAGKQRFRQSIAVDIALLEKGVPKVFIEAKRLDREHTPEYDDQLAKYASHLDDGIAVLTNGRYWQIFAVANGDLVFRRTVDVAGDDAESVAIELNTDIGKESIGDADGKVARSSPVQRQAGPATAPRLPSSEVIAENLKQYRQIEARRRNKPAYTIFSNETIDLIAAHQPTDLRQLGGISGVGRATLSYHGGAILKIVRDATGL